MTGPKFTGGPAFPASLGDETLGHQDSAATWQFPGMSLRDYFAAKAMHQFLHGAVMPVDFDATEILQMVAGRAYEVADAMLKVRNK